ncbi:uncharacterized protein LOC130696001 [Daphnia carinata]|uniref:uncharacterized protein LOC130696001 n=1 Tax=Daphnia carinata TaxID=120202 RepID=UPI00257B8593|nr:uncharacterized protein LOC130696001 [Daphnia carinata]
MEADVQKKFNHLIAVTTNFSSDVQSEALHVAIRGLLKTIQNSKKQEFQLANLPANFLDMIDSLIQNKELSVDLAIVAGRVSCLTKVFIQNNPSAVEQLTVNTLQAEGVPKICLLFGIIDCLPNNRWDVAVAIVAEEIAQLLLNFNSVYVYQMKLFHTWLEHVRNIVNFIPNSSPVWTQILLPQSRVMELIDHHWETSQIRNLSGQCLTTICDIWRTSESTLQYANVVAKITLTNLTWQSQPKYLILATLVPFIHFKELLFEYPDTIYAMTVSLTSNPKCLLAGGTSLFKALTKHLNPDDWEDYCQSVLLEALNHANPDMRCNAANHWLPCMILASPVLLMDLKQRLRKTDPLNWLAYMSLLKLMNQLDENDILLTQQALHHGDEDVRVTAFGILLHKTKKTEIVRAEDWTLVKKFLLKNLRCDNSQCKFKLLSTTRFFLIRVLKSCLSRMKAKCTIDEDIENLRQLCDHLLKCLTPTSCYQKKITLLDILCDIHQLFGVSDTKAENLVRGSSLTNRSELIKLAGERWNFTGKESLERYTICLMDENVDVRQKAAELLQDFFPCPPSSYVQLIYNQGLVQCDNSWLHRSECGVSALDLVSHWSWTNTSVIPRLTTESLVGEIYKRFHQLKLDWTASGQAVHGFIGALAKVLQVTNHQNLIVPYTELMALTDMVSCYVLDILSSKSIGSPVIMRPLDDKSPSIDDRTGQNVPVEKNGTAFDDVQHKLILTRGLLTLKESSNLAVQITTLLLNDERLSKEERVHLVEQCVHIVYQILLRCRHEYAVEAAGDAMELLCKKCFVNQENVIRAIPGKLLENFLGSLENSKLGTSDILRPIGMAFLVNKIVCSQSEKSQLDSLVTMATRRLIRIAERPVDMSQGLIDACNVPQPVAIHVLTSLVQDALLNVDLQPELMDLTTQLGVNLFNHPLWFIRHAAVQLHGAIVTSLVGSSSKTTAEFFHKLPGLETFFLGKLAGQTDGQHIFAGDLIPVLSILSRLSPDYRNEDRNSRFKGRLVALLGHPAIQIRQLVARSLLAFVPLPKTKWITMQLCEDALTLASRSISATPLHLCVRGSSATNSLHGCLLAIHEFINRCREIAISVQDWEMIRNSVATFVPIEKHHPSFYIKLTILKIFKMLKGMAGTPEFFRIYRDESVRQLYYRHPGFSEWLALTTELVLGEGSLNSVLEAHSMAIQEFLAFYSGLEVVEAAMRSLTNRFARFSRSSVMANHINSYITYFISRWQAHPSLVPICLEFIQIRGASALQESETSLREHIDFFLNTCIEMRHLGSAVALLAFPTASIVIKEAFAKGLLVDNVDEVAIRLSRCILNASQQEESLPFRLAAATSLKTTGKALMEKAMNNAQLSRNLFFLIMYLIHDEAKEVRTEITFFLTELVSSIKSGSHGYPPLLQMSAEECLEQFASQIHFWFSKQHLIPVVIEMLTDPDLEKEDEVKALYECETQNVFSEEIESIFLLSKIVQSFLGTVESDSNPFLLDINVQKVVEGAARTVSSIRSFATCRKNTSGWFFIMSKRIYSMLSRLGARLSILAMCCPSYKADSRFVELQKAIDSLGRYQML